MTELQPQPAFVLVRPQLGENIGAAARAMWNFGLERMRLVAPRDGWPNAKAAATASGAGRLLDAAMLCPDLDAAIGDLTHVFATTARPRDLTRTVLSPEAAMARCRAIIAEGGRPGIVFGPERAGLENADLAAADALISVPVNPRFASLNLAQSVLLLAYEWGRDEPFAPPGARGEGAQAAAGGRASKAEIAALSDHYERKLEEAGFFFPPEKAATMKLNLRAMWGRLPLGTGDVRMLHGMLRQLTRARRATGEATGEDGGEGENGRE